jgi:hypothetical protein
MRLRTIAWTWIACASCISPVSPPGHDVYTDAVTTVVLERKSDGLRPPPPDGASHRSCSPAAVYTLAVGSHALAWKLCADGELVPGSRVLTATEWTALEDALEGLVATTSSSCGSDSEELDLTVSTATGGTQVYRDDVDDCGPIHDRLLIAHDGLWAAEDAMRRLATAP